MDAAELLWRQYEINVDLHKHYLKLLIEFNVFYYAITGAIVSYYFAHSTERMMEYALLLPFTMSVLFAGFFIYGAVLHVHSRGEMFRIRDALGLKVAPDFAVLIVFLAIFALLKIAVAVSLGFLMWCRGT